MFFYARFNYRTILYRNPERFEFRRTSSLSWRRGTVGYFRKTLGELGFHYVTLGLLRKSIRIIFIRTISLSILNWVPRTSQVRFPVTSQDRRTFNVNTFLKFFRTAGEFFSIRFPRFKHRQVDEYSCGISTMPRQDISNQIPVISSRNVNSPQRYLEKLALQIFPIARDVSPIDNNFSPEIATCAGSGYLIFIYRD